MSRRAELQELVENEVERRRRSLDEIRRRWPCIAEKTWFDEQCVKPGDFYTLEFRDRYLLSGYPGDDSKNNEVFYKTWIHAFDLPAYLRRLSRLVNERCEDVWRDPAVVDGIAELMDNHSLEEQAIRLSGPSPLENTSIAVPSQETMNLICGKITRLYLDAILRRINLCDFDVVV